MRTNWRSPEKKNLKDYFFGEHLRLCPWSLALASSISVIGLERLCPRKGCPWPRIFLCPWPWPRALCPRLHLWYSVYIRTSGTAVVLLKKGGQPAPGVTILG